MRRWLDRCATWGLDTLGRASAHPVFWLLVLGYALGVSVALALLALGQPDTQTTEIVIRLPER